jgi:hypothetical protein
VSGAPLPPKKDPVVAAVLGLVWPGLGHVYAGRASKGLLYCVLVAGTFAAGMWMTRGRAVDPGNEPLWFAGQLLAGAPTLALERLTQDVRLVDRVATFELGMLYTAVAGLMNVIAIADALGLVERRGLLRRRLAEERAREAAAREAAWAGLPGAAAPAQTAVASGALAAGAEPSPPAAEGATS